MTTAIVHDARYRLHNTGSHPECIERLTSIDRAFEQRSSLDGTVRITPRPATEAELSRVHLPQHVARVIQACQDGDPTLDPDTVISQGSLEAALLSAGGALAAVDAVMTGQAHNALVVARPPGHHATSRRAMGFCLFNNVAAAARYAQDVHGVERVLIVDWDVHHGNGTQDIFYQDPSVYYLSLHQARHYPFTGEIGERGEEAGAGFTRNVPLRARTPAKEYVEVFRAVTQEIAQSFQPDLLLISAGFDAHLEDPLGSLRLTDADFAVMTDHLLTLAHRFGQGRVVSLLEGGYNLHTLGNTVATHLESLKSGSDPVQKWL